MREKPNNWSEVVRYWESGAISNRQAMRLAGVRAPVFWDLLRNTKGNRPMTYREFKQAQEKALAECMPIENPQERERALNRERMKYARILGEEIAKDTTGEGFIYQMFRALAEQGTYKDTKNMEDLLWSADITAAEVVDHPAIKRGLYMAMGAEEKGAHKT